MNKVLLVVWCLGFLLACNQQQGGKIPQRVITAQKTASLLLKGQEVSWENYDEMQHYCPLGDVLKISLSDAKRVCDVRNVKVKLTIK